MKKFSIIFVLLLSIFAIGCESKVTEENTIHNSALITNKTNKESDSLEASSDDKVDSSLTKTELEIFQSFMNESIDLAKTLEKIESDSSISKEERKKYANEIESYVNGLLENSFDLSEIPSDEVDFEGLGSFIGSLVEKSIEYESLNGLNSSLIDNEKKVDSSDFTIDMLYDSVLSNDTDLTKRIIMSDKVDINAKTSEGKHVLEAALTFTNCEMIELLLLTGADPELTDSSGVTFKDQIEKDGSERMREIFDYFISKND